MNGETSPLSLSHPGDRQDRLIAITGHRDNDLRAEYAIDTAWRSATIYQGADVDAWRQAEPESWNRSVTEGILPSGSGTCVWAYWFDLGQPSEQVSLRLRAGERILFEQTIDLITDHLIINHLNITAYTPEPLSAPWSLSPTDLENAESPSIHGAVQIRQLESEYPTAFVENADHQPLVLQPNLKGWHRIYLGMEPDSSIQFSLSNEAIDIPVPNENHGKLKREYFVSTADLTDQDIIMRLGGSRVWKDASIRYIRFVSMIDAEIQTENDLCIRAATGRPFAGYLEQLTDGYYIGETISLREFTRNEMRLHKLRGCTEVYAHVIRIGFSAWYHSNVIDQYRPEGSEYEDRDPAQLKWSSWMDQGDPLVIAIEEAREVGLKVIADAGMNITYLATDRFHYRSMTGEFAQTHPEYMCADDLSFFDYRHEAVREYAASIIHELLMDYDLDGIHLDFARFAYNKAFDHESLIDTVRRINESRQLAVEKWKHPVTISTRIPSYIYHHWDRYEGDFPEFLSALKVWSQENWIERVMVCCMLLDRLPELQLDRYLNAIQDTRVELWGDLYCTTPEMPTSRVLKLAEEWRDQGLDGGYFLYSSGVPIDFDAIHRAIRAIDTASMPEST